LKRRAGREAPVCLHPSLERVLRRTLGVPLFQEQLLRMAMIAAGFTGGEAEELRRAFGFKRSERRMKDVEVKLRRGMDRKGITGKTQDAIVQSITSFALYGFPESHAASFALLAYASAWLKCRYPAAFTAAILNNQPLGFSHPGALNFVRAEAPLHRRDALWHTARAVRPPGELFRGVLPDEGPSPLAPMTADERLEADYRDTGLTIGPHPMALRREEMRRRGVLR